MIDVPQISDGPGIAQILGAAIVLLLVAATCWFDYVGVEMHAYYVSNGGDEEIAEQMREPVHRTAAVIVDAIGFPLAPVARHVTSYWPIPFAAYLLNVVVLAYGLCSVRYSLRARRRAV